VLMVVLAIRPLFFKEMFSRLYFRNILQKLFFS